MAAITLLTNRLLSLNSLIGVHLHIKIKVLRIPMKTKTYSSHLFC